MTAPRTTVIHSEDNIRAKLDNTNLMDAERKGFITFLQQSTHTHKLLDLVINHWKEDLLDLEEGILKLNERIAINQKKFDKENKKEMKYKQIINENLSILKDAQSNDRPNVSQEEKLLYSNHLIDDNQELLNISKGNMAKYSNLIKEASADLESISSEYEVSFASYKKSLVIVTQLEDVVENHSRMSLYQSDIK